MTNEEYKNLSIKEFTKVASVYEGDRAGIYEMCKKDYPDILSELEKELFMDLLDAGCGPAPMISLLPEGRTEGGIIRNPQGDADALCSKKSMIFHCIISAYSV